MKKIAMYLIRVYQKTLSMDHGPLSFLYSEGFCRFRPTCSQYSYEAIEKYGLIKGSLMGLWRICRCNPWARGGYDPVE
jgi:putative membrane protein insertion efficiency factor